MDENVIPPREETNLTVNAPPAFLLKQNTVAITSKENIVKSNLSAHGVVIADGLAELINHLCQFAHEFGLNPARVLRESQDINDANAKEKISKWLTTKEGLEQLPEIFQIIKQHQLALLAAADDLTRYILNLVVTKKIKAVEMLENHDKYFQEIFYPGFIESYCKKRK